MKKRGKKIKIRSPMPKPTIVHEDKRKKKGRRFRGEDISGEV